MSWLAGTKVLPTNHGVPEHDYQSSTRWDQNPIDKQLRLWSLRKAHRIHVEFPGYADGLPAELRRRVVAIPNAISPSFLEPAEPVARQRRVIGVGALRDVKNYRVAIDAWAICGPKHPGWTLELHGEGPQRAELAARIQELGLESTVRLMGHTSAIKPVYLESELLVHPALFEGFGLSVAEGLALGVPVVAFGDCEGVKELVQDGANGLLVARDGGAQALAHGLDRLMSDEPLRLELRARAPGSIQQYGPAVFRARWTALLDEIVADGRAGVGARQRAQAGEQGP